MLLFLARHRVFTYSDRNNITTLAFVYDFYVMGKVLSGELSSMQTGLVSKIAFVTVSYIIYIYFFYRNIGGLCY